MIRIGGPVYYNYIKEPHNSIGSYLALNASLGFRVYRGLGFRVMMSLSV